MRIEKEIKMRLKAEERGRRETHKRFLKYDNVDDMHALDEYDATIAALQWVLESGEPKGEGKQ